jgi:hypothetical protein
LTGILLLFLLSFLLLGPKKTSELTRELGKHLAALKRSANSLQAQIVNEIPVLPIVTNADTSLPHAVFDLVTSGAFIPETEEKGPEHRLHATQPSVNPDANSVPEVSDPVPRCPDTDKSA